MLVRLVLGLLVLKAVVAGPRFSRQVDLDSYDSANYDVDLDNLNSENQDIYDYDDGLTIDDPQVRNRIGQSVSTREEALDFLQFQLSLLRKHFFFLMMQLFSISTTHSSLQSERARSIVCVGTSSKLLLLTTKSTDSLDEMYQIYFLLLPLHTFWQKEA